MLAIDKDVPLPVSYGAGRKKGSEFPFIDMAVGDSFFVPNRTINRIPVDSGLKGFSTSWARTHMPHAKWLVRSLVIDGVQGVRVWRVQ